MKQIKKTTGKSITLTLVLCLFVTSTVLAASGALDTTFSGDGKLTMDFSAGGSSAAFDVAVQSDGKIVTVGDVIISDSDRNVGLARFKPGGALDTSFNGTGKVITDLGAVEEGAGLVIDKTSGKITVAGQKCETDQCDVLVLRYKGDGTIDTTFSSDGVTVVDYGGNDNGSFGAIAAQSDGKIVVGGYMYNTAKGSYDFAVYRFTSAGALDKTFNSTGKKAIDFGATKNDFIFGVVLQPADGKIVVAGETCDTNFENCNFALARLNTDGSLDTSFNTTGKQTTDFGANDYANAIAIQKDGKLVLAGAKATSTTEYFALARYNTNGKLDTTFAGTGKKTLLISGTGTVNRSNSVLIQAADQKILVSGFADGDFAIARLTSTGGFDTSFNGTGKVTVDFGGDERCRGLAIQPSGGKYVLAGSTFDGSVYHWALARLLP